MLQTKARFGFSSGAASHFQCATGLGDFHICFNHLNRVSNVGITKWLNLRKPRGTAESWIKFAQNRELWRRLVHGGLEPSEPDSMEVLGRQNPTVNSSTKFQTANRGKLDNMRRPIAFLICLLLVAIQISLTSTSLQENNYLFRRGEQEQAPIGRERMIVDTIYYNPSNAQPKQPPK
ncbi:hypothetical protein M8J76_001556 [Diaphorina citri]|nr:hypothetical protein M8J75_011006 [Diaphorina citri]KAI5718872.1 hypothetical protein M8J76_001556 [Diaphorina citri]